MTKERSFKRRVRERMSKTGERYTTARSQVVQKRDRLESTRLSDTTDRPSDDKVLDVTGKKWDTWFSVLDEWGARERKHGETAGYLSEEHSVPGWWAQAITMWYERSRGLRLKHQQADGFTVYASKTIAVPGIELDRNPFACMLGGPDGRTLFILAAEWRGMEGMARRSQLGPARCSSRRHRRPEPVGRRDAGDDLEARSLMFTARR